MDAAKEKKLRESWEVLSDIELSEKKKLLQAGSEEGQLITKILNERRVLVGKLAAKLPLLPKSVQWSPLSVRWLLGQRYCLSALRRAMPTTSLVNRLRLLRHHRQQ